jgi:hypothetical protein
MLAEISLEDLAVTMTVVCILCLFISTFLFIHTIRLLHRIQRRMEIERMPYVVRDANGKPLRQRK